MKYYLVKETAIATAENPNPEYITEVMTIWYGKGDSALKRESIRHKATDYDCVEWMLPYYGYKRKCDAKRNYTYRNASNSKYWECKVDIVEVEI